MATYDAILDLVRPQLALAPEVSMRWATLMAMRRFCQESRYWRETVTLDVNLGQERYKLLRNWLAITQDQLDERDNAEMVGIQAVQVDGEPYEFSGALAQRQQGSSGRYAVAYPPDEVSIFPLPDSTIASGLQVSVVVRPKPNATVLPQDVVTMFAEQIGGGALAILKRMKGEPWSDAAGAIEHESVFRDEIAIAQANADRQHRPRGFRVKAHP